MVSVRVAYALVTVLLNEVYEVQRPL